jgi:hypothetical protein
MINRHNYEEYLLMYVDGELSSSERVSVETFLESNPDLKEELELLRQTVLQPDEYIEFPARQSLYRKGEGIGLNNYQEYFLLYIDNELGSSEKQAVETFVLQQPQLQDEFTLLKQTILASETIIFTNKESLYRKEEKRRPVVISLRWASLAAAIMIGIVALVMFNNKGVDNNTDSGTAVATPHINPPATVTNPTSPEKTVTAENQNPLPATVAKTVNKNTGNKNIAVPLNRQEKNNMPQQDIIAYKPQEKQETIIPAIGNPAPGNAGNPAGITEPETTQAENNAQKNTANSLSANNSNLYVQNTAYTEEDEKDKTLYLGAMQVNPDKVRGFFRKATRFLSSKVKSNDGDDGKGKVKIANLEMNKIK